VIDHAGDLAVGQGNTQLGGATHHL
jgi:hypothetical protein